MPEPEMIVAPTPASVSVALEPAHSALNDLFLLVKAEIFLDPDEWITRTAAALTPERRRTNYLILIGLHYAIMPQQSWPSFPAYIDHLATQDPVVLRDRVLNAYARIGPDRCLDWSGEPQPLDSASLLANVNTFLDFLRARFPAESIDPDIEAEAHRYLNDPPAMQSLIVSHFRYMWEHALAPEWEQVLPMLKATVEAFRPFNLSSLPRLEAAQRVLGPEMIDEKKKLLIERPARIIFAPAAHMGRQRLSKLAAPDTLWIMFGARLPESASRATEMSRAELLVRLAALADDTRLRILQIVREAGELRSQDVMAQLDLSQSAASRHLTQLSATGYLDERRCEGAKCYTLNARRIEETLRALAAFLLER